MPAAAVVCLMCLQKPGHVEVACHQHLLSMCPGEKNGASEQGISSILHLWPLCEPGPLFACCILSVWWWAILSMDWLEITFFKTNLHNVLLVQFLQKLWAVYDFFTFFNQCSLSSFSLRFTCSEALCDSKELSKLIRVN